MESKSTCTLSESLERLKKRKQELDTLFVKSRSRQRTSIVGSRNLNTDNVPPEFSQKSESDHKFHKELVDVSQDLESSWDSQKLMESLRSFRQILLARTSTKTKRFYSEEFKQIASGRTNLKSVKKHLQSYKDLYHFMLKQQPVTAMTIRHEYFSSIRTRYFDHFSKIECKYHETLGEGDVISNKICQSCFSLNGRDRIFCEEELEFNVLKLEHKFKAIQQSLTGISYNEYKFIQELFLKSEKGTGDLLKLVIEPCLKHLEKDLLSDIDACFDVIGLLLSHQLMMMYKIKYQNMIKIFDEYWTSLEEKLLERFKYTMGLHILSLDDVTQCWFSNDDGVHYISIRYAKLSSSIQHIISHTQNKSYVITQLCEDLFQTTQEYLVKLSELFEEERQQLIFLINNYDWILRHIQPNSWEESILRLHFTNKSRDFMDLILNGNFADMLELVNKSEHLFRNCMHMECEAGMKLKMADAVDAFNVIWRDAVCQVFVDVVECFGKKDVRPTIMQRTFAKLMDSIAKFYKILPRYLMFRLPDMNDVYDELNTYTKDQT